MEGAKSPLLTFHYLLNQKLNHNHKKKPASTLTTLSSFHLRTVTDALPKSISHRKLLEKPSLNCTTNVPKYHDTSQVVPTGKSRDVSYIMDQQSLLQKNLSPTQTYYTKSQKLEPIIPRSMSELKEYKKTLSENKEVMLKDGIFREIPEGFYEGKTGSLIEINSQKIDFIIKKRNWDLGVPSSRSDAIALLKWLDQMLSRVRSDFKEKSSEKFELVQALYYACFKEILRQVSVQCTERGIALQKIWHAYLELIRYMSNYYASCLTKHKRKIEADALYEKQKLGKELETTKLQCAKYKEQINGMEEEITGLEKELELVNNEYIAERKCWEHEKVKLTEKVRDLGYDLYKSEELNKEINVLERKLRQVKGEREIYREMLNEIKAGDFKIKCEAEEQLVSLCPAEVQTESITYTRETQCDYAVVQHISVQTPRMIPVNVKTISKDKRIKQDINGIEEEFCTDHVVVLDINPKPPNKVRSIRIQTEDNLRKNAQVGTDSEETVPIIEIKVESNDALVTKIKENNSLKEELESALKKLAALQEENNRLEIENYHLKENIESVKDHVEAVSVEEEKIKELMTKPSSDKVAHEKLLKFIRELLKTHESIKLDLTIPDRSFLAEVVDTEPKIEEPTAEIWSEIKQVEPKAIKLTEKAELVAKAPSHFRFVEFKLGRRKELRKKRTNFIVQELKERALKQKMLVQPLPKKMLLRLISYFYTEMSKAQKVEGLAGYVYNELTNKYGLKSVADRKFLQVMVSCISYKNIKRVQLFGRFLGLYDELTYDDFKWCIELKGEMHDSEEKYYVTFAVALECSRTYFERKLSRSELNLFYKSLENSKTVYLRGKALAEYIELDSFIEIILEQYAKMSQKATDNIAEIFFAADFDLNGLLTFDEFTMIMLAIEPQVKAEDKIASLFAEYSDITDSAVEYLSLDKLATLSVQTGLFSVNALSKLLNKTLTEDFSEEGALVKTVFDSMRPTFVARLTRAGQYSPQWDAKFDEFAKRFTTNDYSAKCIFELK